MQNYFDNEATSSTLHATMKPARGGKSLVTFSTYEDRKEALLNTTILDDAGTCRSKSVKINTTLQPRQQTEPVDSREVKPETYGNIPKPPPPIQIINGNKNNNNNNTNNNATYKVNNSLTSQTIGAVAQRLSNGYQNNSTNDNYSKPNKITSSSSSTTSNLNGNNSQQQQQTNRHTIRLGTMTIGEYRQQSHRREPEKFDFIASQKRNKDSGDTTPTNEALQSELQSTLSRANLRKTNGNSSFEHQRNCPLHQQQQQHLQQQRTSSSSNVEELSKKLQKSSMNDSKSGSELLTKSNNNKRSVNNTPGSTTVSTGILKNGSNANRNGTSSSKSTEKSIKFG